MFFIEFLDLHNVLYDKQFGFRQRHSTSHAVITLVEKITHALDSGKVVGGVFIDFKKAYDTVSHDILSRKLETYGIKNNAIKLIKSFLSDRKQYVQYLDRISDVNPIRSGLFQTVNDPGGGGALKAPPPYDLENYHVNLHHIIHVNFTRCFWHDPIGIF